MWWLHGRSWGGLLCFIYLELFLESWIDEELWVLLVFCRLWFHFKLCRLLGLLLMLLALARKLGIFAALQFMILLVIRCSLPHYTNLIIILDSFFFLGLFLKKLINLLILLSSVIEVLVLAFFFSIIGMIMWGLDKKRLDCWWKVMNWHILH